ncbi:MAG: hypothetical protein ABUJ92_09000 [Desulfobacterales bacterium]
MVESQGWEPGAMLLDSSVGNEAIFTRPLEWVVFRQEAIPFL